MTDTQNLSERLRAYSRRPRLEERFMALLVEAADALDTKDAEIERLRALLDTKVLEDLDRATRNRGARVAT